MTALQPWQDVYPGIGVCRYCGSGTGPVCGSYQCNELANKEEDNVDPDEALNELRKLVAVVIDGGTPDGKPTPRQAMEDFAELFDGLDGWMSKGGFLPKAWQENR